MKNLFSSRFCLAISLGFVILLLAVPMLAEDGFLRTRVNPAVAGVFVNGQYKGTVSQFEHMKRAIRLAPGEYKIEIIDPRYEPLVKTVKIEAGKTEVIRERLTPKPLAQPPFGKLKIKKGERAAIFLNNAYYGQADEFNGPGQELLVKPGTYNLRVVPMDGRSPLEQKVTITANKTTTITMQ